MRLHVVTGKGGTGKTTVAAALALALAGGGKQVLLVEVEGRQSFAQLFDTPPLPYEERKVAVAPGGGDVYVLSVDPEDALLDYLHMFYKLSPTGVGARALRRMGAIEFATTIAPGLRDVLLTGKVKEAVVRTGGGTTGPRAPPAGPARLRRRRARRPADRPHRPVPQHQLRDRRPGQGRPAQDPVRRRHGRLPLAADRRAPRDAARGDARAGDDRRRRRARRSRPARRRRSSSTPCAPPLLSPLALRDAEQGTLDRGGASSPGSRRPGWTPPTRWSTPCSPRRPTTRPASRSRSAAATPSPRSTGRRTSCRCCADAVDLSGLYELAGLLEAQGIA